MKAPEHAAYDHARTKRLRDRNFRVLRLSNQDVTGDLPLVIATIAYAAERPEFASGGEG